MGRPRPHITVVGLGPAGLSYLGAGAIELMASGAPTYLRTARHPAAEGLAGAPSFDHLYESADTFDAVYRAIVEALVAAAIDQAPDPIVYAVPGSPLVAERTVELLRQDARVDLTVVPALSFLDLAWARLGIDPIDQAVHLIDAEQFAAQSGGARGPFLVAQCWSQPLLSEIKLSVSSDDGDVPWPDVVLLHHLGLEDEQVLSVSWWDLDRTLAPDHLTSLYIPELPAPVSVEREMARLEELMVTLRARCPWDRVQTHGTLMPHLVEESYEVLDALRELEAADPGSDEGSAAAAHLQEELGDLLFQIVFHARLGQEGGAFTLADVARGVHDKLVHRHPHVFGEVVAATSDQVVTNWEAIKQQEKGRSSITDGIPMHLPALQLSTKLQRKALSAGMPGPDLVAADRGLSEQVTTLEQFAGAVASNEPDAALNGDGAALERLVGDLLFGVANLSRQLGIDPEGALRDSALTFRDRVIALEVGRAAHDEGPA